MSIYTLTSRVGVNRLRICFHTRDSHSALVSVRTYFIVYVMSFSRCSLTIALHVSFHNENDLVREETKVTNSDDYSMVVRKHFRRLY